MERNLESTIPGWGVDLDPRRRPAFPKEKVPAEGTGAHWDRPEPQHSDVEVLHSMERGGLSAVYGTSCPPRGLSGVMRRRAYRASNEARMSRWFLLYAADRVDVVEGVIEDLRSGHVPNLAKEMGLKADLKHNKKRLLRIGLMAGLAAAGVAGASSIRRRRR